MNDLCGHAYGAPHNHRERVICVDMRMGPPTITCIRARHMFDAEFLLRYEV